MERRRSAPMASRSCFFTRRTFAVPWSSWSRPDPVSWTTALAIYFVAWWLMLFVVLPFGVRSQEEEGSVVPGTDPGAPVVPLLVKKLIWNTILTGVVCG